MSRPDPRRSFRHSRTEAGQIIVIVAFAAIALFAMVGLAVDAGRLYITKAELSRAVDSAALSGILEFNGTTAGLDRGVLVCEQYFESNEPDAEDPDCVPIAADNEMTVDASKTVDLLFLSVLGVDSQTVSAHAKAGFGVQFLDAALVIDATGSMDDGCNSSQNNSGCPIYEAKEAAKSFKDILLGASPDGNVAVGTTALRGCFRANPQTATAPMSLSGKPLCVRDDNTSSTWVTDLTYNLGTLNTQINNIFAEGGSGTNPCGGLSKGWEILEGSGNHLAEEDNLRFLILLSDGDSNYYGHYTYQSSPYASPHTYQTLPCQPPSSCSNVGGQSSSSSDPCHDGVHVPATTLASDSFGTSGSSCPSNWASGSGWLSNWAPLPASGNDLPTKITSSTPNDSPCHVRIRGVGSLTRSVNLSSAVSPTLTYYAKYNSWESGDDAMLQVSTNGTTWTTLFTHTTTNTGTSYSSFNVNLASYAGQANLRIRFLGSMTANDTGDNLYIDTITVTTGNPGSSDGYLNGHNGSPATCSSAVRRERQVDILTWNLAKAIEADDVVIIVVGFGVCDPDTTGLTYTQAQCNSQIGNTDHDNTADERLLKCIASSAVGSNDHYYYAASASDLPGIFTQIASQIAHRLIE